MEYNQSTYGRSYPQEHYGNPPPKSSPTMGDYISAMDFCQGNMLNYYDEDQVIAFAAEVEDLANKLAQVRNNPAALPNQTCDNCGGEHPTHECQSGNENLFEGNIESIDFVSNFCRNNDPCSSAYEPSWSNYPNSSWDDFEVPLPTYPPQFPQEQVTSIPCESKEEFQQEEELYAEIESMVEMGEEKDEETIEQFEEISMEKLLEMRVEDTKEKGDSNLEEDIFVIPPYIPSQHLELKIMLGQVKGKEKWIMQIQIYFLEATKGEDRIVSSSPKVLMSSMRKCKGKKFFCVHGWANFPFDPGGMNLWSG